MSDLHEVVFRWPYNANEAIVTGTFDQWSRSVRMSKGPSGFTATVRVPWESKVLYKFIVDGNWTTIDQAPTEADWRGFVNNVYRSPTKPKEPDTPRYEPPATRKPEIAPAPPKPKPAPPIKDTTPVVEKKDPSPPVAPVPVVPVNDTKPVDTPPPAKTSRVATPENVSGVLPTPANLKSPLAIVPVNDASNVDRQPPVVEPVAHTDTPSTHALPVNNPRKSSTGTASSNTLPVEKKEEEPRPVEAKQPNGITNGVVKAEEPAQQSPATPVKDKTPTLPATPATPPKFASPPTTPKKPYFPGSTSSSPTSSPSHTISRKSSFKKKRDSFINKVKHIFTPEKEKEHHKEKSHD